MKIKDIRAILKGFDPSFNLYRDEPTKVFHMVYVNRGKGQEAIDTMRAAGLDAMWVTGCSHLYSSNLQVRR